MSAVKSQNDFDAVRAALESIFEANEAARRGLYEKQELFNDNFIRFSVSELHSVLKNTPRRKLPFIVEKVLADFNFCALHGEWGIIRHDAPDFTLVELPNAVTSVVAIQISDSGYKGTIVELGDQDFFVPKKEAAPKPKPEKVPQPKKAKPEPVVKQTKEKEETFEHANVGEAPSTVLEIKRRRIAQEKLSPEERRQASGTYQQLKFCLLSLPRESLDELAETLNIGELESTVQGAVNDILAYIEYKNVSDAASNMGITLKSRNADAALLEFLIAQSN